MCLRLLRNHSKAGRKQASGFYKMFAMETRVLITITPRAAVLILYNFRTLSHSLSIGTYPLSNPVIKLESYYLSFHRSGKPG